MQGRAEGAGGEGGVGWEGQQALTRDPHFPQRLSVQFNNGEHGFDNSIMDMKTIFRAVGPSFKRGLEVEPFESIHVYELMCRVLGIVPEANDGLLSTLLPTLQEAGDGVFSTPLTTTPSGAPLPSTCTHCASRQLQVMCACTALTRVPSLPLGVVFSFPVPGSWELLESLTFPRHLTYYSALCASWLRRRESRWM